MKDNEPLLKGGCGHSVEDVKLSAIITVFVCFVFLILILISLF